MTAEVVAIGASGARALHTVQVLRFMPSSQRPISQVRKLSPLLWASVLKLGGCVDDFVRKNVHRVPQRAKGSGAMRQFFFFF